MPHKDPVIINIPGRDSGMLQSHAIGREKKKERKRNNKLQLFVWSLLNFLPGVTLTTAKPLHFLSEIYGLGRFATTASIISERNNSAQIQTLGEMGELRICDISVECFRGPNCFMTFRRCLKSCIKKSLSRSIGCTCCVRCLCPSM